MFKKGFFFKFLCVLVFGGIPWGTSGHGVSLPSGFVYLHDVDPSIRQDIDFGTRHNFTGRPLKGYYGNQAICTREAAEALSKAQTLLKKTFPHHSLLVTDAYRPVKAVKQIRQWALNKSNSKEKDAYFPNIHKSKLLGRYVGARRSSHSRGSAFDIFIMNEKTGKRLDYGPMFFGRNINIQYKRLSIRQYFNRYVLRNLMVSNGFKPYNVEFWHFTLLNEPFPKTYFNFDIYNDPDYK